MIGSPKERRCRPERCREADEEVPSLTKAQKEGVKKALGIIAQQQMEKAMKDLIMGQKGSAAGDVLSA